MTEIPTRTLGRTNLEVTTLGYGAMELRELDDENAETILNTVLDAGINFIDTSIDYGRSEELIGRFASERRSEYFLASKCGCVPNGSPGEHLHTAANVRAGVENSLRLMKTDYLDIVQFHRSLTEAEFNKEGALEELLKLRDEGKVRFLGVSATLPHMQEQVGMSVFDVFQVPYSALQREHEAVIAEASASGAGIIIRGGVARGVPTDWEGREYYMITQEEMKRRWEEAQLDELLTEDMDRMELILRFTLSDPNLDTTIVGTKSTDHLRDNVAAALKGPLPDDLLAEAKQRLGSYAT